jgi:hypothetical protein
MNAVFANSFGWTPMQALYPAEVLPYHTRAKGLGRSAADVLEADRSFFSRSCIQQSNRTNLIMHKHVWVGGVWV